MELLWITPKWPFPVADGARIATTQLIKNLTAQGMRVHLCSIVPEDEVIKNEQAELELGVAKVTLIRRPKTTRMRQIFGLLTRPFFPITLAPYADERVATAMRALVSTKSFDLIVYDGLHAAAWRLAQTESLTQEIKEAYRAHNVESDIWFRGVNETSNVFKKALLYFQGGLVKRVETSLVAACHFTFPVSFSDEAIFQSYSKHGVLHTVPIGIQVALPAGGESPDSPLFSTRNILFVGKLDWPPNREGLRWVLEKAWPEVRRRASDITLTVVGSGERAWLEAYRGLPGLNIVGQVDSLAPYYENCIATLVPVFYGSGTRVKAIESSLYGRMCISTQIGVEGMGLIPGENYCRAETADDWIQTLVNLKSEDAIQMGKKARTYARTVFDPGVIAKSLIQNVSRKSPAAPLLQ